VALALGQQIRVLLISARENARDEVAAALGQRASDYRLYWVAQFDVALARAQDLVPNIIIVDDELEGITSISAITSLAQRIPGAALIALVSPSAVGKANLAVLAGARGFLVKPLQTDELLATMRLVHNQVRTVSSPAQPTETQTSKIVAVCAPKGGTGRTTTVINIGYWLTKLAKTPVVLVDADFASPALDVSLNLHSDRSITDLIPRIARLDSELLSSTLESHNSGLTVLLAPSPATWNQEITLPHVQQILNQLRQMFGWVVIDLGIPLSEMAYSFLDSTDYIVMTVLPEMGGLRNATWMLEQLHTRGYPDDRISLLINRATLRGGVSRGDIEQHLHMRVKHIIPDDQVLATYAINRGVPFSMSHPNSSVSKAMRGLVELVLLESRMPDDESKPGEKGTARKSLFKSPFTKKVKTTD